MTRCSVPFCSSDANHHFPKDPKLRNDWLKAIGRDNFVPRNGARICRKHFHRSDYVKISHVTGLPLRRRCLKKFAVPTVFAWNGTFNSDQNEDREERRKRHQTDRRFNKTPARRHHGEEARSVSSKVEFPSHKTLVSRPIKTNSSKVKQLTQETQTLSSMILFASTEQLLSDDESVLYYTGLNNYSQFTLLLSTLLPMANEIKYLSKKGINLTAEDQFLMLLIKLRRYKPDFELGKMFGVSKTDVSNIIVTWVSFVTDYWSLLDSWPNQNIIYSYMPQTLRDNCPADGVVSDAEIPIKMENSRNAEKASFSQYRLKKTLKFIAECAPGGLTFYCLEPQTASTSGLQIRDGSPISGTMCLDQELAKSIPMEKLIGSTQTFRILASALNQIYAPLSPKIFSVCLMICSIKVGIVTVNKENEYE